MATKSSKTVKTVKTPAATMPREGTKQATALKLIKARNGATLAQLSKAVNQEPATVRSLVGWLVVKGHKISADGESRYTCA